MGEDSTLDGKLTDAVLRSNGVVATARRRGRVEQLEKPSPPRREIGGAR
jgi:hypothetical protein